MDKILYLGNFDFKKGFAACNRIIGNCVTLNKLGFSSIIYGRNFKTFSESSFAKEHNIICVEKNTKQNKFTEYFTSNDYLQIIKENLDAKAVFLYNFPSIPFKKVLKYCKNHGIKVYADITEWYSTKNMPLFLKPLKWMDVFLRMKYFHKKCDGIICISNNLYNYYSKIKNKIIVYPIMDYVLWESKLYNYKRCLNKQYVVTLAGRDISTKDDLTFLKELFSVENIKINILGTKKEKIETLLEIKNTSNVTYYEHLARDEIYKVFSSTNFNYVVRKPTRSNNAGFPSKLAESLVLDIPVIYSDFSDLNILEKKYFFGLKKNKFLGQHTHTIFTEFPINELFESKYYISSFSQLLSELIKEN